MKTAKEQIELTKKEKIYFTSIFWFISLFPFLFISALILFQSEDDLPPLSMLDNPPEMQASLIIAKTEGGKDTILGQYWKVNRTSVKHKEISPFALDALIATEDERFLKHWGVDFRALLRALTGLGSSGGASTITQQLAKQFYTLNERNEKSSGLVKAFKFLNVKARENILAKRLEERYTKEEIITFYFNQVDFLHNAVGIKNASRIYFNKEPIALTKEEAATLVGMCKNPALYNPYSFKIKDYRAEIAHDSGKKISSVTEQEVAAARAKDSIRCVERRNQVLYQWYRNSSEGNEAIQNPLSKEEYERLKLKPLITTYTPLDHKEGMAPYFRESLRKEVEDLLKSKNESGGYNYLREDGQPYNIYTDGLKIYTTLDPNLQRHAEYAVEKHLKEKLQGVFDQNNRGLKNYPFSNKIDDNTVKTILSSAKKNTKRYKDLSKLGYSESEIEENFNTPTKMRVFTWEGEKDTTMTPNDSIKYYKAFLHAGLVSMDPRTGFVRAWVGGTNYKHFAYDHVRQGKRQVGSTMKPFVYAAALSMKVVNPCSTFSPDEYCIDLVDPQNRVVGKYCPEGSPAANMRSGLAMSSNPTTVAVMKRMGVFNPVAKTGGPYQIEKLLKTTEIELHPNDVVPSMCLGSMDLSLYELVAAQCIFPNNGIYVRPTAIERITDRNGKVIYEATEHREQALNASVAYEILKMMKGVVEGGTGSSLRGGNPWGGIYAPTAGKTGTTQNNSDGWFIGITPDLVTGVWVGAEDRSVRFKDMTWGQGGRMALPIYGYYMQKVYKDPVIALSTKDFIPPPDYDAQAYSCNQVFVEEVVDDSEIPFQ
jgi:penicillin-binding protein 1A